MNVLELYAGAGGATRGLMDAGATVTAIDNNAGRLDMNPAHVTFEGDALTFLHKYGGDFDFIWSSPNCQGYSRGTTALPDRLDRYDREIPAVRDLLIAAGKPYVIENVYDARHELHSPQMLCWTMFREPGSVHDSPGVRDRNGRVWPNGTPLQMTRHRMFETNFPWSPYICAHQLGMQIAGAYGGARRDAWEAKHIRKGGYVPASLDVLRDLVEVPWMTTENAVFQAIPPFYSAYIFRSWLAL